MTPLSSFNSTLPEDGADGEELKKMRVLILEHDGVLPTRQWFNAADGLETTANLLAHLRAQPDEFWPEDGDSNDKGSVVGVLESLKQVLNKGRLRDVRFYLLTCL